MLIITADLLIGLSLRALGSGGSRGLAGVVEPTAKYPNGVL
jgi:hypothetical protein